MSKKILIVDDEAVIRKVLKAYLTSKGFEIKEAIDGVQALEQAAKEKFHLIICDVMMPRKDGWQVLSELKSSPELKNIPVILLTAKNEDKDMFKGYELQADYYMTKPFTKGQLFFGINLMLGQGG